MDPVDMEAMKESGEEKSFAELLEEAPPQRESFEPGRMLQAVVVQITPEWVFLDMGGKSEGVVDRKEFLDANGQLTVQVGDTIGAFYLTTRHNEHVFTTRITNGQAARNHLRDAFQNGIPVDATVEREVKGGFEVRMAGGLRGFCPFSHMELHRIADPWRFVGQKFSFRIIEYGEGGRRLVVSRRALLEQEQCLRKESLKEILKEGMVVRGTVVSVRDFGAFVDLGGVQGLLPISEVAWERVQEIGKHLREGQEVEVSILQLDWERDRITLSLKQTLPDPWESAAEKYPEGSRHTGKVVRLAPFGAFVSLEPGLEGLLHISRLGGPKRIQHPRELLKEGQILEVKVESLDRARRRISLSAAEPEDQEEFSGKLNGYTASESKSGVTLGDIFKERLGRKDTPRSPR
ncbi:MAG: 30S ribosomal protein S1 [Thermodesulfobacteriota bacterium]